MICLVLMNCLFREGRGVERMQGAQTERVNKQTARCRRGRGSEPLPSQMETPGEQNEGDLGRETTQANAPDPLLFYTWIKNAARSGWGGGHTCQKVKFNKMRVKRRAVEGGGHVKPYSCSSRALVRWQILFRVMAAISPKGGRDPSGSSLYSGRQKENCDHL